MSSATSNYSKCKFSAKSKNFKNHYHRGVNTLGGKNAPPPRWTQKLFWGKIKSKMNSAPSNYSECKFSAKSDNF